MLTIEIPQANPAWKLIMQSGALLSCMVGIPLDELLREELGLSAAQLAPVDALILDGMPVDEPEKTMVPDKARLALACALPGIAGLAMKKGSAVRGLRYHITHRLDVGAEEGAKPRPGQISLFLYSLTLPQLAGHFLERGITVSAQQLVRYARFAPEDICYVDNRKMKAADLEHFLPEASCRLLAKVMS